MSIKILKANKSHAMTLSQIKQLCWKDTYTGIYDDEDIYNFDYVKHANKFISDIENNNQNVYIIQDSNTIFGYMIFGKSKHPFNNLEYELNALYLLKEYKGLGLGKKLFNLAIETAKTLGQNRFLINCNYYNPSNAFYLKMGANLIGTTDSNIKAEKQSHYIYEIK